MSGLLARGLAGLGSLASLTISWPIVAASARWSLQQHRRAAQGAPLAPSPHSVPDRLPERWGFSLELLGGCHRGHRVLGCHWGHTQAEPRPVSVAHQDLLTRSTCHCLLWRTVVKVIYQLAGQPRQPAWSHFAGTRCFGCPSLRGGGADTGCREADLHPLCKFSLCSQHSCTKLAEGLLNLSHTNQLDVVWVWKDLGQPLHTSARSDHPPQSLGGSPPGTVGLAPECPEPRPLRVVHSSHWCGWTGCRA